MMSEIPETSHYYSYSEGSPPPYLSDSHGRSVTPIIQPAQPANTTSSTAPPNPQATPVVKRVGRPPKDGVAKAAAGQASTYQKDAELKKLEEHLMVVGPTMERMGCVLASEERRGTFLDDEDFEDVGWGSEHDPGDDEEDGKSSANPKVDNGYDRLP